VAVVGGQDMFEAVAPDLASAGPDQYISTFKGEDAITSALIQIREGKRSKVAFLTGHGEPSTADVAPNSVGIGLWRARLGSIGCDAVELNLLGEEIPEDLMLLIIVGPRSPLKPSEIEKIKAYADRGGPLLVLAGDADAAGIGELLRSFNLELRPGVAVDPVLNLNGDPRDLFALLRGIQSHPITVSLSPDRAILIRAGSPIRILGQGHATPGGEGTNPVRPHLVPFEVLRTGQQSWVEIGVGNSSIRFDNGVDHPGPVTVGVAVQERVGATARGAEGRSAEPKPRLVLFSCRSLADNQVQTIEPTNLDLLMNAVSWLRGRSNVVGIAPNTHVALTLTADPLLRSRLVVVPTVMAMIAIIATGILVYLARRE